VDAIYLVGHDRSTGSSSICRNDDASVEETTDDGGTGAGGLGERDSLRVQSRIAVVVAEVETTHDGDRRGRLYGGDEAVVVVGAWERCRGCR
jgi:hypothetical protein